MPAIIIAFIEFNRVGIHPELVSSITCYTDDDKFMRYTSSFGFKLQIENFIVFTCIQSIVCPMEMYTGVSLYI